jgi:putative transposase
MGTDLADPKNVSLDAFVVMPNRIHGIIVIDESLVETTQRVVSPGGKRNPKTLRPNSLGAIVGQFKSVCTKRIHAAGFHDFAWQPRYYDHVIRDQRDFHPVR